VTHPKVDAYLDRSTLWPAEARAVREILLKSGLTEDLKWGKPCYSHDDKNIVIIQEMKSFLSLMFFKGALMPDPAGVLEEQGENSRSAKRMTFTSTAQITKAAKVITQYVKAAIEVEASGAKPAPAPALELADALQQRLAADRAFKAGWERLTPGAQREYNLFIADAKQLATREARVEKYAERITAGQRMRDR
jgi:uncharacterized protein YdeI (YjbR/CyaY-like superfamily)